MASTFNEVNGPLTDHAYFFTARCICIERTMPWQDVCLSVCLLACPSVRLSHAGIVSARYVLDVSNDVYFVICIMQRYGFV